MRGGRGVAGTRRAGGARGKHRPARAPHSPRRTLVTGRLASPAILGAYGAHPSQSTRCVAGNWNVVMHEPTITQALHTGQQMSHGPM